jgi:hypothetical protein
MAKIGVDIPRDEYLAFKQAIKEIETPSSVVPNPNQRTFYDPTNQSGSTAFGRYQITRTMLDDILSDAGMSVSATSQTDPSRYGKKILSFSYDPKKNKGGYTDEERSVLAKWFDAATEANRIGGKDRKNIESQYSTGNRAEDSQMEAYLDLYDYPILRTKNPRERNRGTYGFSSDELEIVDRLQEKKLGSFYEDLRDQGVSLDEIARRWHGGANWAKSKTQKDKTIKYGEKFNKLFSGFLEQQDFGMKESFVDPSTQLPDPDKIQLIDINLPGFQDGGLVDPRVGFGFALAPEGAKEEDYDLYQTPTGRIFGVPIGTEQPVAANLGLNLYREDYESAYNQLLSEQQPAPVQEEPGLMERFGGELLSSLREQLTSSPGAVMMTLGDILDDEELYKAGLAKAEENQRKAAEYTPFEKVSFQDIDSAYKGTEFVAQTLGQTGGFWIPSAAAGVGATLLAGASLPITGTIAGISLLGGAAFLTYSNLLSNQLERNASVARAEGRDPSTKEFNIANQLLAAGAQTALEYVVPAGVAKASGLIKGASTATTKPLIDAIAEAGGNAAVRNASNTAAAQTVMQVIRGNAGRTALNIAKSSGAEGLTETAQSLIERAAAGETIDPREQAVFDEAIESFAAGAVGGAGFGGAGEYIQARRQVKRNKAEAEEEAKKAAEAAEIDQAAEPLSPDNSKIDEARRILEQNAIESERLEKERILQRELSKEAELGLNVLESEADQAAMDQAEAVAATNRTTQDVFNAAKSRNLDLESSPTASFGFSRFVYDVTSRKKRRGQKPVYSLEDASPEQIDDVYSAIESLPEQEASTTFPVLSINESIEIAAESRKKKPKVKKPKFKADKFGIQRLNLAKTRTKDQLVNQLKPLVRKRLGKNADQKLIDKAAATAVDNLISVGIINPTRIDAPTQMKGFPFVGELEVYEDDTPVEAMLPGQRKPRKKKLRRFALNEDADIESLLDPDFRLVAGSILQAAKADQSTARVSSTSVASTAGTYPSYRQAANILPGLDRETYERAKALYQELGIITSGKTPRIIPSESAVASRIAYEPDAKPQTRWVVRDQSGNFVRAEPSKSKAQKFIDGNKNKGLLPPTRERGYGVKEVQYRDDLTGKESISQSKVVNFIPTDVYEEVEVTEVEGTTSKTVGTDVPPYDPEERNFNEPLPAEVFAYHGGSRLVGSEWSAGEFLGTGEGYRGVLPLGKGIYFSTYRDRASKFLKYGGESPFLSEVVLDTSNMVGIGVESAKWNDFREAVNRNRDLFGANFRYVSTPRDVFEYLNYSDAMAIMREAGVTGSYEKLPSPGGDEIAVYDPSVIKDISAPSEADSAKTVGDDSIATDREADDAAMTQRGEPESVMNYITVKNNPGFPSRLTDLLMQVGDLSHRVQEREGLGMAALGRKINAIIRLHPSFGYKSIRKEIEDARFDNAERNVLYRIPGFKRLDTEDDANGNRLWQSLYETRSEFYDDYRRNISEEEIQQEIQRGRDAEVEPLASYKQAHQDYNRPVTEMGQIGKEMAIDLAEGKYEDVYEKAKIFKTFLDRYIDLESRGEFEQAEKLRLKKAPVATSPSALTQMVNKAASKKPIANLQIRNGLAYLPGGAEITVDAINSLEQFVKRQERTLSNVESSFRTEEEWNEYNDRIERNPALKENPDDLLSGLLEDGYFQSDFRRLGLSEFKSDIASRLDTNKEYLSDVKAGFDYNASKKAPVATSPSALTQMMTSKRPKPKRKKKIFKTISQDAPAYDAQLEAQQDAASRAEALAASASRFFGTTQEQLPNVTPQLLQAIEATRTKRRKGVRQAAQIFREAPLSIGKVVDSYMMGVSPESNATSTVMSNDSWTMPYSATSQLTGENIPVVVKEGTINRNSGRGFGRKKLNVRDGQISRATPYSGFREALTSFFDRIRSNPKVLSSPEVSVFAEGPGRSIVIWNNESFSEPLTIVLDYIQDDSGDYFSVFDMFVGNDFGAQVENIEIKKNIPNKRGRNVSTQAVLAAENPKAAIQMTQAEREVDSFGLSTPEIEAQQLGIRKREPTGAVKYINKVMNKVVGKERMDKIQQLAFDQWDSWVLAEQQLVNKALQRAMFADQSAVSMVRNLDNLMPMFQESLGKGYVALRDGILTIERMDLDNSTGETLVTYYDPDARVVRSRAFNANMYNEQNKNTQGGLVTILSALKGANFNYIPDLFNYIFALRAYRIMAENQNRPAKDRIRTPYDKNINLLKEHLSAPHRHPEVAVAHHNLQKWNKNTVQFLVDSGVLDPEAADFWTKHNDYIPFYLNLDNETNKLIEREWNTFQAKRGKRGQMFNPLTYNDPTTPLKKGSSDLADPFESYLSNTVGALTAGSVNLARSRVIRDLLAQNRARRVERNDRGNPNIVRIRDNGEDIFFEVDDAYAFQLSSMVEQDPLSEVFDSGLAKLILANPAQFLRETVTRDPGFSLANVIRDSMIVWLVNPEISRKNIGLGIVPEAIRRALSSESESREILKEGGISRGPTGTGFDADFYTKDKKGKAIKNIKQQVGAEEKKNGVLRRVWDNLGQLSSQSESATREIVYEHVFNTTREQLRANKAREMLPEETNEQFEDRISRIARAEGIEQAREILNFNRRGSNPYIQKLLSAVPFANASLQGLNVLFRAHTGFRPVGISRNATEEEVFNNIIRRGMTVAAASVALELLNIASGVDDWDEQDEYKKNKNFMIPLPGGGYAMIPGAFEYHFIYSAIPRLITRAVVDQLAGDKRDDTREAYKATMGILGTMGVDFPPLAKLAYSYLSNRSSFGNYPIDYEYERTIGTPAEERVNARTTSQSQLISNIVAPLGRLMGLENLSPNQIDNAVNTLAGGLAGDAWSALDMALRMPSVISSTYPYRMRPVPRLESLPLLNRFYADSIGSNEVNAFYDMRSEIMRLEAQIRDLQADRNYERARQVIKDNKELLSLSPAAKQVYNSLRVISKEIKDIESGEREMGMIEGRRRVEELQELRRRPIGYWKDIIARSREAR